MSTLLSKAERDQVAAAIAKAEARCQGEIVFCEAPRSADYARWLVAPVGLMTVALAAAVHLIWPQLPWLWVLAAQVPLAAGLWWVVARPRIILLLVPDVIEIEAVKERALQAFAEHALYETARRAGVLIYISAFERRVEIMADRGLSSVIDEATWQQHIAHLVTSIAAGKTAEGVCHVVESIADRLATQWGPPSSKAANVLPDMI